MGEGTGGEMADDRESLVMWERKWNFKGYVKGIKDKFVSAYSLKIKPALLFGIKVGQRWLYFYGSCR